MFKKPIPLIFGHNFCDCIPVFKILSLEDSQRKSLSVDDKILSPHRNYVATATLSSKFPKSNNYQTVNRTRNVIFFP